MSKKRVSVVKVRMASVTYSDHLHNHGSVEVTENANGEGFFGIIHGDSEFPCAVELTWSQWESMKLAVKALQKGAKKANKKADEQGDREDQAKSEPANDKPNVKSRETKKKKSRPKTAEKPAPEVAKANG